MSAAGALGVCLALAASVPPDAPVPATAEAAGARFVPATQFTLAWTHSIEKVRWEEDYRVAQQGGLPVLVLDRARIQGSGAGMDPPPDAVRHGAWYEYVPATQPDGALRLTRSEFTPDFDWCTADGCQPLGALLPSDHGVTLLWACRGHLDKMAP